MSGLVAAPDPVVVLAMRATAGRGEFDGRATPANKAYLDRCRQWHAASGTWLIYTRDTGHHSSGWFKNPDYERCLHLSLSFTEPNRPAARAPRDRVLSEAWARLFFGDALRWAWAEPPVSKRARELEVWHYRLFCDGWWQPLKPRGEVYSTEFTARGWKSASELFGAPPPISPLYPG